jgi:hypothetical protein
MPSSPDATWFPSMLGERLLKQTRITFGKYDIQTKAQVNNYLSKFNLTKKHHSYKFENIHVIHMDTSGPSTDWDTTSEQYNFVIDALRKANANPAIKWIIVAMYRAMYGSPSSSAPEKILSASLRDIYHPIFQSFNVHLVLQGYWKNYQRMHCLQYNPDTPDQPIAVHLSEQPDYFIPVGQKGFTDGCIFVNVGTGGSGHESIDTPVASYSVYNNSTDYGVLIPHFDNRSLDAIGNKVNIRFYDITNTIKDQLSISHLI